MKTATCTSSSAARKRKYYARHRDRLRAEARASAAKRPRRKRAPAAGMKRERRAPQPAQVWDHIRLVYVTGKLVLDARGDVQRMVPQSYEEIAADFGVSPRAVRDHAQRGGWSKLRRAWRQGPAWVRWEIIDGPALSGILG